MIYGRIAAIDCRKRRHHRRGYTLVELIATSVMTTIVVAGMSSALVIGARALPDNQTQTPADQIIKTGDIVQQIADELQYAQSFTTKTATQLDFYVADRNGDAATERIQYSWSGTAGASLTRQYNNGTAVEVLKDVREFQLSYDAKVTTVAGPPSGDQESAEMMFIQQNSTNSGTASTSNITSTNWCAAYFKPTFAAEVTKWRIMKVKLQIAPNGGTDGSVRIQIRTADSFKKPTTTILDEVTANESSFVSGTLYPATLANASNLTPGTGYCAVIRYNAGSSTVATMSIGTASTLSSNTLLDTSTNSGSSWTATSTSDLWFEVWGTVTTPGTTPTPINHYWLRQVGIGLRAGSDSSTRTDTAVQIMNMPEVASP